MKDYNINWFSNKGRFSLSNRLDLVLSRLEGVRKVGNGWVALCPAHDDHNPSLSIGIGSDGRILLHCFAGCSIEEICSAMGIELKDLFPENRLSDYPFITRSRKSSSIRSSRDSKLFDLFNSVYSALISLLTLSAGHIKHLLSRGLSREEVRLLERRGYRTLPKDALERASIAIKIARDFGGDILKVPGFYATKSNCPMFVGFGGGLFIPVRDVDGRIIGAQVRVDEQSQETRDKRRESRVEGRESKEGRRGGKYRWFSSSRYGGPSSGTPTHVALPEVRSERVRCEEREKLTPHSLTPHSSLSFDRVWIVEGVLKADICALKLGEPVIGIPGVTAWDAKEIDRIRMRLGAKRVIIAFDADLKENEQVRIQRNRLADELLAWGADVWIAEWDLQDGKGLDDLLVSGGYPELRPFKRAPDLSKIRSNAVKLKVEGQESRVKSQKMKDSRLSTLDSRLHEATPELIERLRDEMTQAVREYVRDPQGQVLLIRGFQGLGKTITALKTLQKLRDEEDIRPIYVAPRHDLLEQAEEVWTDARHILPRAPRFEGDEPRCPLWHLADYLAFKRYSVPKNLCFSGICGLGMERCPYYRQFETEKPLLCTYELASNETVLTKRLLLPGYRHVMVFDEFDPFRLMDRLVIVKEEVRKAIEGGSKSARLLSKLELAFDKLSVKLREEGKLSIIGREALEALIEALGGEEEVEELLKEEKASEDPVPVRVDGIVPETEASLKIWIGDRSFILPSKAVEIVSPDLILVERWAAEKHGLIETRVERRESRESRESRVQSRESNEKPSSLVSRLSTLDSLQRWAERLPVNFLPELRRVLQKRTFNLRIRLGVGGRVVIEMLLLKRPRVPRDVPIIVIDPYTPPELIEEIFGRPVRVWEAPKVKPGAEVIQIIDGRYGHHTLLSPITEIPTPSAERLRVFAYQLSKEEPEKALIVTWKAYADQLREAQEKGELPEELAIEHYGALEGLNCFEDRDLAILIGAPQAPPQAIIDLALALWPQEEIDVSKGERWLKLDYEDCNGQSYEVRVNDFKDDRLAMLSALTREAELAQCARRIRDVLGGENKRIILLTNIPVPDLLPDQIYTLQELAERWEIEIDQPERSLRRVVFEMVEKIVKEGIEREGDKFWITVNGAIARILNEYDRTEDISLVQSYLFNQPYLVGAYVREAFREIGRRFGLKKVKVVLPGKSRGGRRLVTVWAARVARVKELDVEEVKRQHLYAIPRALGNLVGGGGCERKKAKGIGMKPVEGGKVCLANRVEERGPPEVGVFNA